MHRTDKAVKFYLANGATAGKINMGIPLYGRAFEDTTGIGAPYNGVRTLSLARPPYMWPVAEADSLTSRIYA